MSGAVVSGLRDDALRACVCVCQVASVISNSLRPCGPSPAMLLCPQEMSRWPLGEVERQQGSGRPGGAGAICRVKSSQSWPHFLLLDELIVKI